MKTTKLMAEDMPLGLSLTRTAVLPAESAESFPFSQLMAKEIMICDAKSNGG